eukprot:scaffold649339_cov48-Prasinocladus_malaysianus.AAC.1
MPLNQRAGQAPHTLAGRLQSHLFCQFGQGQFLRLCSAHGQGASRLLGCLGSQGSQEGVQW